MTNVELKEIRKNLKLTQQQMADKIGTSRSNYSLLEVGNYGISSEIASKVQKLSMRATEKKADAKAEFMAYIMASRGKKI